MFSKKFFIVCIFVVILTPLFLYTLYYKDMLFSYLQSKIQKNTSLHTVTLTEDGFKPRELTIKIGDTIVFNTTRDKAFWPASNVHPEHTGYPEFDPKKPIAPDKTWSFTFKKGGQFGFHDHISANYTGNVTVGNLGQDFEKVVDISSCASVLDISEKQRCWDNLFTTVLNSQGLSSAFKLFIALYNTEPSVPKDCHGWGHLLGKASYKNYKNGENPELHPEASYCGYGFFHGFISELIKDTGDVNQTKEFCKYVTDTMGTVLPNIKNNCVHGVGHGTASLAIEDPQNWGNLEKITKEALVVCESVFSETGDLENCFDGVFNETYVELANNKYGLDFQEYLKKGDVYWFCNTQKKQYQKSCYYEYAGLFGIIFQNNVLAGTKFALEHVPDLEKNGAKVIARIAADRIEKSLVNKNHQDSIEACALTPQFLFDECFNGIINGFVQHGEPQNFHVKALEFCKELPTTHPKSSSCVNYVLGIANVEYSAERKKVLCASDPTVQNSVICK